MSKKIKKNMTIDDLAEIIVKTLPTKEDLNVVKLDVRENTKKLSKIEIWMEDIDTRLDGLENRMDKLEYTIIRQYNKRIERLEAELDRVKKFLPA